MTLTLYTTSQNKLTTLPHHASLISSIGPKTRELASIIGPAIQSLKISTSDRRYYDVKPPSASQRTLASYHGSFTRQKNRSEVGVSQGKLTYQVIR